MRYCSRSIWTGLLISAAGIFVRPTNWTSMAQGLFKVGPMQGRNQHTTSSYKNALCPVSIPLKRVLLGARWTRLRRVVEPGERPFEVQECWYQPRNAIAWHSRGPRQAASTNFHQAKTLDPVRVPVKTGGWNASQLSGHVDMAST